MEDSPNGLGQLIPFPIDDQPRLERRMPDGTTVSVVLGDRLDIGRHPDNRLCVSDKHVSKFHCFIELRPEGFVLVDCDSRHGVLINGKRVKNARLSERDAIQLWGVTFIVRFGALKSRWPTPLPPRPRTDMTNDMYGDNVVLITHEEYEARVTDDDREAMRLVERLAAPVHLVGDDDAAALNELREHNARWAKCRQLSLRFRTMADPAALAVQLTRYTGQVLPVESAVLFLFDRKGQLERAAEAQRVVTPDEVPVEPALLDAALHTQQVAVREAADSGPTVLAVPLETRGAVVGVLYVTAGPAGLNPDDRRMLYHLSIAAALSPCFR